MRRKSEYATVHKRQCLYALSILAGAISILLIAFNFNTSFHDPLIGGDPYVLYNIFVLFSGHPEVYVFISPCFGIISHLLRWDASKFGQGFETSAD